MLPVSASYVGNLNQKWKTEDEIDCRILQKNYEYPLFYKGSILLPSPPSNIEGMLSTDIR